MPSFVGKLYKLSGKRWLEKGEGTVRIQEKVRFLPKTLNEKPVLVNKGGQTYLIDNAQLRSNSLGIAFRFTKNMLDKEKNSEMVANWGCLIEGTADGDWLKVHVKTVQIGRISLYMDSLSNVALWDPESVPESVYTFRGRDGSDIHPKQCIRIFLPQHGEFVLSSADASAILELLSGPKESRKRRLSLEARDQRDERLWYQRKFPDAIMACGGRTFPVHRAVLAASSSVFERMLESDMKEGRDSRIEIMQATPEGVEAMLHYIYTGSVPDASNAAELFGLAQCYELGELGSITGPALLEDLTASNVKERVQVLYAHAENPKITELWREMLMKLKTQAHEKVFESLLEQFLLSPRIT